jgi:hypothetical protein
MQVIRILNQVYLPGKYWSNRNKTSRKFKLLVLKIRNLKNQKDYLIYVRHLIIIFFLFLIYSFLLGNYCEHGKILRKEVYSLAKQIPILAQRNTENFDTSEYSKITSNALKLATNEQKSVLENIS